MRANTHSIRCRAWGRGQFYPIGPTLHARFLRLSRRRQAAKWMGKNCPGTCKRGIFLVANLPTTAGVFGLRLLVHRIVIINPARVDAYIAKKGLVSRVSDSEWRDIFEQIVAMFGHELWHRCRLVHQADETWGRFSTAFPDAVPQPYRHLRHVDLLLVDSPLLRTLQDWLSKRQVPWQVRRRRNPETGEDEIVGLLILGYDSDDAK